MNAKVHLGGNNLAEQENVFRQWIDVFDDNTRESLSRNYLSFKHKIIHEKHEVVTLFASSALLRLEQYVMLYFNDLPENPTKKVEDEMALLEAWLINNATFDLEVAEGTKPEAENLLGVLLVNQAAQYEFTERKDFVYQTLLAHAFFEFLTNHPALSPYLQEFLTRKHVETYGEYLRHLIGPYSAVFTGDTFGFRVTEDNPSVVDFFDSIAYDLSTNPFTISGDTQPLDPDFKLLRAKPLIKEDDGTYYPLHYNFFVDKIYQGLVFDFYQTTSVSDKHKSFGNFLQFLGQEFAETHLFYKYIAECFLPKKYLVAVSGNQYKDIEYSDYYVREGNTLFLFEFKNSLMRADVKQSKDFSAIRAEITKKFVYNPDNKKDKGIGQLLNVMNKIAVEGFPFDDLNGKHVGRLHIFPIIVYTDDFFSLDGVQNIVSEEFQKKLSTQPIKRHQVNDVTLMHLQDIIDIQFLVQTGQISFKAIMQEYASKRKSLKQKKTRTPQELLIKYSGFRSLVHHLIPAYADQQALLNRLTAALGF